MLLDDLVNPLRKGITAVAKQAFKRDDLTEELIRRTAMDRIGSEFIKQTVEADFLPGVMVENPAYTRLADTIWEFLEGMDVMGLYNPVANKIQINRYTPSATSTAVHELAHHVYEAIFDGDSLKAWGGAVKQYGPHPKAFDSIGWIDRNFTLSAAQWARAWQTESLAYTIQDLLTPGQEIGAPLGLLREVEKLFSAPGLIDRVAHRLPAAMAAEVM